MNYSSSEVKNIFFDCLNSMAENSWRYTIQENAFTRKRKYLFLMPSYQRSAYLTLQCLHLFPL